MTGQRGLTGKVALITGGGSGIGRATALRLASEGVQVFVVGRRQERLDQVVAEIKTADGKAESRSVDLCEPAGAARAVATAAEWGGGLDILVNVAGTFPYAPFPDLLDDDWDAALDINLSAAMRTARAAVPLMSDQGGAIVNVSSINAVIGDKLSACSHYSAAKAGLLGLTRQLAIELAPKIRVNAVVPGAVDTEMLEGWNSDPADMKAWLDRFCPLGRIARPDEIAAAIAFLASEDASYITGATLMTDGGMAVV